MNELSTIGPAPRAIGLIIPDDIAFDDWIGIGSDLAGQRREMDWMIADWLAIGQDRFSDQVEFEFLADKLGIAPKRLKAASATAIAFPTHLRDASLSVDHHAHVASLPSDDALTILRKAHLEHWTPEETRVEAMKRKVEIGQGNLLADDDYEYQELLALARASNRARPAVRREFAQMLADADYGVLDV